MKRIVSCVRFIRPYQNLAIITSTILVSGLDEKGGQLDKVSEKAFVKTKEYVWRQTEDYVGVATKYHFAFSKGIEAR